MKPKFSKIAHNIGMTQARQQALKDISKETCKAFTRNYVPEEYKILAILRSDFAEEIPLNL